jgi:hypothetical protein
LQREFDGLSELHGLAFVAGTGIGTQSRHGRAMLSPPTGAFHGSCPVPLVYVIAGDRDSRIHIPMDGAQAPQAAFRVEKQPNPKLICFF